MLDEAERDFITPSAVDIAAADIANTSQADPSREECAMLLLGGWVWETDELHRFCYMSRSVERVAKKPREWHYGKTRQEVGHIDFDQPKWKQYREQLEARKPFGPIEFPRIENGKSFWMRTLGVPRFDAAGKFLGYRGVGTDITGEMREREQRLAAEAALEKQKSELVRSNQDLVDFARVASHDLQEPLRKIEAFSGRLVSRCGSVLPEDGKMYVERISDATRRMRRLVTDLLNLSRTGDAALTKPVNLKTTAVEALSDLQVRIEEAGAIVEVGDLPTIESDETMMRQLFQNLIGNSLKFARKDVTPRIVISSSIERTADATAPDRLVMTFVDNGIGFDPVYNEKIFGMFQRLHGKSEYDGSGIGLSTCRKIVERHQGSIIAHGKPGQGATFTITLPMTTAKPA